MGTTPENYFENFVYCNYVDCNDNKGNIRYAFNAAVSASHLADHYYNYYNKHDRSKIKQFQKLGDFLDFISDQTNGCFKDIRSISNAYKHLYSSTNPKKATYWTVSSPGVVESILYNGKKSQLQSIEEDYASSSEANNFETRVVFTRRDGNRIDFFTTLETVINFWNRVLKRMPNA
jgi:hypothetical protein